MKRLFYILLIIATPILFGCNHDSKNLGTGVYRISEVDSTRLMNEILEGIIHQGEENQRIEVELYEKYPLPPICHARMFLQVEIDSKDLRFLQEVAA